MKKRKKLILNAIILTLTTMTLGFISMVFRVYLSNKIGAEGMGLFQIIMSINAMTCTLAISGVRVTVTRLVAEELGKGNAHKVDNIMKKGLIYCLFFSTLSGLLLYNCAEFISIAWVKDARAILPLKILSCSLPFVAVSACFAGYFYGTRKVVRSVIADILESLTMMAVIVFGLSFFLSEGLEYTCSLVVVGMSLGVMASTLFCYIMYLLEKKNTLKKSTSKITSSRDNMKLLKFTSIAFPIACSAYIQTSLKTVEDILIPNSLRKFGASTASSLSIFGIIKGMVLPVLSFPSMFFASFSTLIIPEIAEANALHKHKLVNYIISKVFKFTLLIAVFATGIFIIFSQELGLAIYKSEEVGIMMRLLAPLIPLMYLDRVVDGSLNALNKQMSTLKFNLIDMSTRILMILVLIPKMGVKGFIIVIFASTIINSSLSINKLLKVTGLEFKIFDWLLNPIFCISLSCFIVKYIFKFWGLSSLLVPMIITVTALYFVLLIIFRCIRKKDIMWFVDGFRQEVKIVNFDDIKVYKQF